MIKMAVAPPPPKIRGEREITPLESPLILRGEIERELPYWGSLNR